jgi:hypothetical protein
MRNAKPLWLLVFIVVIILSLVKSYLEMGNTQGDLLAVSLGVIGYSLADIIFPLIIGGIVAGIDKARGKLNWDKTIIIFSSVWFFLTIVDIIRKRQG